MKEYTYRNDVDYQKKQLSINGQIGRPANISGISEGSKVYQRVEPKTYAGTRIVPISDFVLDEIAPARERYLKKSGNIMMTAARAISVQAGQEAPATAVCIKNISGS